MRGRTRGLVMAVCGIALLGLNVIDAVDRGTSVANFITIATGAFLLVYGFSEVGRDPD